MTRTQQNIYQVFKYTIYALLALNIWFFFSTEWAASAHRFRDGVALKDVIEAFAASIDTAAWVVLLLMFELETYVLEDHHLNSRVEWTLQTLRALCYIVIVYAFYGYIVKVVFLVSAEPLPGLPDLCALAGGDWAYAAGLDDYRSLTAANCGDFSTATSYLQFEEQKAVVGQHDYVEILRLAWVDVINAGVWLLVVFLLELDVHLQAHDRLHGTIRVFSNWSKYVLYSVLLAAAVYWGIKGDFVDFWDAFLWLVAFAFIEMNFFEWQQEMRADKRGDNGTTQAV